MTVCPICQHAKRQAIDAAMDSGRYLGLIARQFRLDVLELEKHRAHRQTPGAVVRSRSIAINEMAGDTPRAVLREMRAYIQESSGLEAHHGPETPQDVLKRGLPYVRQAVRLAGDDPQERERIVAKLNEVLMDEHLGLP
jgi:hypothetical protein